MTVLEYSVGRLRTWRANVRWRLLILTLVAWPFTAAGAVAGALVVSYRFVIDSVQTGYADVRGRYPRAG